MTEALLARLQMALSLGFHIVFAAVGVAMPLLMVIAEVRWLRSGDPLDRELARAWAKGTAVLFAVGAVSGTVLSFELGLLFPGFMAETGALIGLPFALEGAAFFLEAIFLGVYLYGWDRVRPAVHALAGAGVAASGAASAVLVTFANAWMQRPVGHALDAEGRLVAVDPAAVFTNAYAAHEIVHLLGAVYMATALAVAGVHAVSLLRAPDDRFHRRAFGLALALAVPATLAQPLIGHWAGQQVARYQPAKLAAAEGQFATERGAGLKLGGIPDYEARETRWALEVPGALSFLATSSFDGEVQGLEDFPRDEWPSPLVHYAWQVMVGIGSALAALAAFAAVHLVRRREWPRSRWFLKAVVAAGPLAFVALEAGWVVTEVGRQPWIAYGLLRTEETVTPMPGLVVPCVTFTLVYVGLAAATVVVLRSIFRTKAPAAAAAGPEPSP